MALKELKPVDLGELTAYQKPSYRKMSKEDYIKRDENDWVNQLFTSRSNKMVFDKSPKVKKESPVLTFTGDFPFKSVKGKPGFFRVPSISQRGIFYETSLDECSCKGWIYHHADKGTECPQMKLLRAEMIRCFDTVKNALAQLTPKVEVSKEVLSYLKQKPKTDAMEFVKKFGEEALDILKERNELYEKSGFLYLI